MGEILNIRKHLAPTPRKAINVTREDWEILADESLKFIMAGKEYEIKTLTIEKWVEFSIYDFPEFVRNYAGVYSYLYKLELDFTPESNKKLMNAIYDLFRLKITKQVIKEMKASFARICKKYFNIPKHVIKKEATIHELLFLLHALKLTQTDSVKKKANLLHLNQKLYQSTGTSGHN